MTMYKYSDQYSKTHSSRPRTPKTSLGVRSVLSTMIFVLSTFALGSILIAASCAPAIVDNGDDSTAPGVTTGIITDSAEVESDSFVLRWVHPLETGTKSDGTALRHEEIGYRIYYLAGTTGQDMPSTGSIKQNAKTQIEEVIGAMRIRVTRLEPKTLYFVTIASFNSLSPQRETVSDEVFIIITGTPTLSLDGTLSYEEEHEFGLSIGGTITPTGTPSIPSGDSSGASISYSSEKIDGTKFVPELSVDDSGSIMIDPTINAGTARYLVRAEAMGYTAQNVMITIIIKKADFVGDLAYALKTYMIGVGTEDTITPESTPSILDIRTSGATMSYRLTRSSGTEFSPDPVIDGSGIITVNPINTIGTATFTVQVSANDYNVLEATLSITIIENVNAGKIQVSAYYSDVDETTDVIPIGLGQSIAEDSMLSFALTDSDVVLTLSNLTNGDHIIHFGSDAENYSGTYQEMAVDSTITILKSELATNSFSFTDGAAIGISGPDITDIQHVATYRPSNIYGSRDLQAMRKDLARDYVLKRDIVFTPMTDNNGMVVSNYEAIGDSMNQFEGSLDGANYTISGIEIVSTGNYQGLFRFMKASSVDTMIAQNLVLRDFKITGNAYVGSLAGWVKKGMVDNIRVEVSHVDAGKVELSGSININGSNYSYGGGLLGRAGTGATDTEVIIQNTSSAVAVLGTGSFSSNIGGLVGNIGSDVVLTESYATGYVMGTDDNVGGLVGGSAGTVTGYATGDVDGVNYTGGLVGFNAGIVMDGSYATGTVTGSGYSVGGLVGTNADAGTVTGYATGNVTGSDNNIGGLIGNNRNNTGIVTGYATGLVMGIGNGTRIGGLVGNSTGTVTGYATGDVIVTGSNVGGLIGWNEGTVTGYATGDVIVTGSSVGGLVGTNSGTVTGYARSIVRRSGRSDTDFGKVIGSDTNGTVVSYSSGSENQIYDGGVGTTVLADTTGLNGTLVTVDDTTTEAVFSDNFMFGTVLSEWTWVDDGKWPAINIAGVKLAGDQPTEASDGLIALVDFEGRLNYEQEEYEVGLGIGGTIRPDSTPARLGIDNRTASINYLLIRDTGTVFDPELAIDGNGVITIASTTNEGTASYTVQASANGYNRQDETFTIIVKNASLEGTLVYPEMAYVFTAGLEDIIIPDSTPAIPNFDTRVVHVRYSIEIDSGTVFDPAPSIEDSGIITINPISTVGTATYTVQASADDYLVQEVTLSIAIVDNVNAGKIQVSTYYSNVGETTDLLPVELGQAVADDGTFSMLDDTAILTLSNLTNGDYTIHFGSRINDYGAGNYLKTVSDGTIEILKSELTANSVSFASGARIGISGPDITGIQNVATYRPSHIYSYQDLQAMREDLGQAYVLKKDIAFIPMTDSAGTAVSNYEAVGDDSDPFTGSLNGANYTITGLEIVSTEDYQGIFGVMEADVVDAVIVRDLVLSDLKIKGNAIVGSLAGQIKRGIVSNVRVEVSGTNTGLIEVSGEGEIYGGGLVGRAGTGATDIQVRIENVDSAITVSGTGANSSRIGGLAGEVDSDAMVMEISVNGSVTGVRNMGGLVGRNAGMVRESSASGYVTGTGNTIGGLVGWNVGTIVEGAATGIVTGDGNSIGGLVGSSSGTVLGYATGDVTGNGTNVGGLMGNNDGTVSGYATGNVTGKGLHAGGLVGYNAGIVMDGSYATGDVTGMGTHVGGVVGYNSGTVMGASYTIGTVTGTWGVGGLAGTNGSNGGIVMDGSYATGTVIGSKNHVGGLVGYNGGIVMDGSYATGTVTGSGYSVGGLVGTNADAGAVSGYATGNVTGMSTNVGGLVGNNRNDGSIVSGYATGNVTGSSNNVGGLVGHNGGTVSGYATGTVTGIDHIGGLVGINADTGKVMGYARSIVRRSSGTNLAFGKTIGSSSGGQRVYNSISKSKIYNGAMGTTALAGTIGVNGATVNIASATQATFAGINPGTDIEMVFGTAVGEWTWVVNGKWPAINIGEAKPAGEQPINP